MNSCRRFVVLLLLSSITMTCSSAAPLTPPKGIRIYDVGMAPDFTLQDMDGETFTLSSKRGNWVFLHFWASWCGPCRKEMPEIQKLTTVFDDSDFSIVMVNTSEDEDTVFSFLAETGIEVKPLLDIDGSVTEAWKPRGLPTTFLIDPEGNIRYQAIGGREWSKPAYIKFLRQLTSKQ
jgi:thiol-disulfide isomerase/thioredoxin